MKICLVGWEFPPPFIGGQGRHLFELSQILSRRGHYVNVFAHKNLKNNKKDITSYEVTRISTSDLPLIKLLQFSKSVSNSLKNDEFDVYHFHGPFAFFTNIQPLVITTHTTCFGEAASLKKIHNKTLRDLAYLFSFRTYGTFFDKTGIKKAKKIIVVNNHLKNELETFYKIERQKIVMVPNGVNTKQFYPLREKAEVKKQFKMDSKGLSVLYIGRLEARKNIESLLKAIFRLKKRKKRVQLIIAGTGERERHLKEITNTLGITNQVKFMGYIEETKLNSLYNAADLFILPSIYEGMPLTILETMACGTPAIVANFSGIQNIIGQDFRISVLEDMTVESLVQKICFFLNHPDILISLGIKAAKYTKESFSWETTTDKILNIYSQVMF